ncbi:hypothetical protein HB662_26880 [Roseomonas frigidaquae]|uniref:Uncharacterized protein n=1 Tax=Falsiroseomonas frigidaquae TaxID=487318 RepID=A0ABX1F7Z8_9PROT|nr:hypothetical protein [Falsiroseomonas frigidaquae]NKE48427.1 hypothetical protein [Falsiroseomonas frigidaquae]
MSEHETLRALAPAENTPQAIRTAITRAETEHAATLARVAQVNGSLPDLLLRATDAELNAAGAEAAAQQRQADRIGVFLGVLRTRLAQVLADETAAEKLRRQSEVVDAINLANGMAGDFAKWMRDEYPKHAGIIAKAMEAEAAAIEAWRRARNLMQVRHAEMGDTPLPTLETAGSMLGAPKGWAHVIGEDVVLPAPIGGTLVNARVPPVWLPVRTRGFG